MSQVRPYRLPGRRVYAACEVALREAAQAWCAHWLPAVPAIEVKQAADGVEDGRARDWTCLRHDAPDLWMIARISPADRYWLANHAAGGPALAGDFGGSLGMLGETLSAALLQDFGRRVLGVAPRAEAAPEPAADQLLRSMTQAGAGAAVFTLEIAGRRLLLGVSGAAMERLAGRPKQAARKQGALTPRAGTLGPQRLRVRLSAGSASITVRELHQLQPGDVIRLDSLISEPLKLQREDGSLACRAHLGSLDGAYACQVSR